MAVNAASWATMTAVDVQHIRTFTAMVRAAARRDIGGAAYPITRQQWLARQAFYQVS